MKMSTVGNRIAYGLSLEEYRKRDGLSASAIKAGRKSMKHMRHAITTADEPSASMRAGSLIHLATLEPDRARLDVVVYDGIRRGKAWEAFRAAQPADAVIVSVSEHADMTAAAESARNMSDSIRGKAGPILEGCKFETSMFWDDPVMGRCKIRPDAGRIGMIGDLKSGADVSAEGFAKAAFRYGYFHQLGFYRRGVQYITGKCPDVYVIAVEAKPPFDCVVFKMTVAALDWGENQCVEIAERYRNCERVGVFPGASDAVVELNLPDWAVPDVELE